MTFFLRLLESLFPSFPLPVSTNSIHRILVVDLNFLGDMVLSSPVYRALKQNLPHARVEALVFQFGAPAVSANPYVDRLHIVESTSFVRQFSTALSLRKEKFDLVLQLNTSLKTNFLLLMMGGTYRLGYNYSHRGCFNNVRIPIQTRTFKSRNRVDECVELLEKAFGWHIFEREMIFQVEEQAIQRVQELLVTNRIQDDDVLVGMHTNTRQTQDLRQWDQGKFASVANVLIEKHNATIVFTGTGEDRDYVGEIVKQVRNLDKTLNVVGTISLQELAALLKRLNLFITLNTGPMHIAIAQETPTVALIGGTPAPVIFPTNDPRFQYIMDPALNAWDPTQLHAKYTPAIRSITVDQVLEKVEAIFRMKKAANRDLKSVP